MEGVGFVLDTSQGGLRLETTNIVAAVGIIWDADDVNDPSIRIKGPVVRCKKIAAEDDRVDIRFEEPHESTVKFAIGIVRAYHYRKKPDTCEEIPPAMFPQLDPSA